MGKALYREYRPKTLDGVIGQEHITSTLKNALKKGAISHAYLFTGPKGVGKTSIARILAHEINGLKYDESKTQLDIIEIDAASNRRIDEIRDLRDKVHIAPTSSKYKVYIIDEVHMLTREAFNALLKTLEEPPEHAIFILATTEAHKVPETIISRTQKYTFKPIGNQDSVKHLRTIADSEKINISDDALELLAEHGRGSFRDSISMLDQIAGFGHDLITKTEIATLLGIPDEDLLIQLVSTVDNEDVNRVFDTTQKLREQGAQSNNIAKSLISLLRSKVAENDVKSVSNTVELMKQLLPLTGASSSYEAIEIALLGAMQDSSNSTLERPPESEKNDEASDGRPVPAPRLVETSEESEETTQEKAKVAPRTSKATASNDSWEMILNEVKGKHNTLYGILRMAQVNILDDRVSLIFSFDFHRKQLESSTNFNNFKDIVNNQLGRPHELEIKVKKLAKQESINSNPAKDNDVLTSVSNIFGDVELLES